MRPTRHIGPEQLPRHRSCAINIAFGNLRSCRCASHPQCRTLDRPRAGGRCSFNAGICIVRSMKHSFPDDRFVRIRGARENNLKSIRSGPSPRRVRRVHTASPAPESPRSPSARSMPRRSADISSRSHPMRDVSSTRPASPMWTPSTGFPGGRTPAASRQREYAAQRSVASRRCRTCCECCFPRAGVYPRGQPMLYAEDFSPNTAQGACPDLSWTGIHLRCVGTCDGVPMTR